MSRIILANKNTILDVAKRIQNGEVIVLPTETVYGLGADATNEAAVAKIFKAKNRPAVNPLIIHVADQSHASQYATLNKEAEKMIAAFWPGALTLILNQVSDSPICNLVTAGLPTIAVRCPQNKVMRDVIKQAKCPIAAPSANNSGEPSATTPQHAAQSLGNAVEVILADGNCEIGLESTILDLSGDVPEILRPGSITIDQIKEYLPEVVFNSSLQNNIEGHKPKSPGQMFKHYAPSIPVRLNAVDVKEGEALLAFGSIKFMGVINQGAAKDMDAESFRNLSEDGDLEEAASNLFKMLRELDTPENEAIAVMNIPDTGIGIAINERLQRAAKA